MHGSPCWRPTQAAATDCEKKMSPLHASSSKFFVLGGFMMMKDEGVNVLVLVGGASVAAA